MSVRVIVGFIGMIGAGVDPRDVAADLLNGVLLAPNLQTTDTALLAIAFGVVGLCDRLDAIGCLMVEECEEEE